MCLENDPDSDFESQSPKSLGQISTVQDLDAFIEGDMIWFVKRMIQTWILEVNLLNILAKCQMYSIRICWCQLLKETYYLNNSKEQLFHHTCTTVHELIVKSWPCQAHNSYIFEKDCITIVWFIISLSLLYGRLM